MKTLVFFTSSFPYGKGEAFIESEFPYLYKAFEKVIIVTNDLNGKLTRSIPEDVEVIRYPYASSSKYKSTSFFSIFTSTFRQELSFTHRKLGLSLNKNILFTILGSFSKGYETRDLILENIVNKYNLNLSETWFYAYWMNDMAMGLALLKRKFPQVRAFCRAHRGDLYFYTNTDSYLPLRTFLLSHLNHCFVISEDGKKYLGNYLSASLASKVVVSKLGTSNDYPAVSRERSNELTLVSCSTITIAKRVERIAFAIAELSGIKVKWMHFGDGLLRARVEDATSKLLLYKPGVEHAFMSNYTNNNLIRFYADNHVDIFINVSSSEGIPVSIMEAMSFGIPVIATAVGGTGEIVKHGYNGYLMDPDASPTEIARTISEFAALPEAAKKQLGDNARLTWNEHFNAGKNYVRFIDDLMKM